MPKKNIYTLVFFLFLIISGLTIYLFNYLNLSDPLRNLIYQSFSGIQKHIYRTFNIGFYIKNQNNNLSNDKKINDFQKILNQNKALKDQFETSYPKSINLLYAQVVSAPSFIPGISFPESLIVDKGKKDNVRLGFAVVVKDNLVGKISAVTDNYSKVNLVGSSNLSFTGKTQKKVLGVVKGQGNGELVFDNILLSEKINIGDTILTNGDLDIKGIGFAPDLIVGKIILIEKNPSALFQKADVKSNIDFSKLNEVFIIIN